MSDKSAKKAKKQVIENNTNQETDLLKTQLSRALADYDNLRRRTDEDKVNWIKFSSQTILTKLLTVLDSFEKAQEHLKDGGLAIAILEFKKLLNEEGLEEISPKAGDEFNHDIHEVIETVEGEDKGKIVEILVNGWKYKEGRVLRFAKVKVSN